MERIDRLLMKAMTRTEPLQKLEKDNPYMGKSCDELLDYLSGDNYRAPDMGTPEWNKFIYAMMHAESEGDLDEVDI